jgi:putative oxidoreductase
VRGRLALEDFQPAALMRYDAAAKQKSERTRSLLPLFMAAREKTAAMMDVLLHGVGWTDLALTLNRIAVGAFFMLSGYHKLFNAERHSSFVDELKGLGVHAVGFNQWWVPLIEFSAGAAVLIGLLAPLAALGLLIVILVAIATSGRQRINLYKPIDGADRIDDWLYLPETLYAFMLVIIVSAGAGPYSLDALILNLISKHAA